MSPADQTYALEKGLVEPDPALYKPDPVKVQKGLIQRETDEQNQFRAWMRQMEIYEITPRSDKRSTIREGHPDHTLFHFGGRIQLIEMKSPAGRLSEEQEKRHAELAARGFEVCICRSFTEARTAAKRFL